MQTTPLLTVEDWLMSDPPEGVHTELINGVIEMSPIAGKKHQILLSNLINQIALYQWLHPGNPITWCSPSRMPIPDPDKRRGREPDLGLYAHEPESSGSDALAWLDSMPIVVAEVVSEGQELRDYVDKRLDYHRARVPEYWILDHARRLFLALRWNELGWTELQFQGQGVYTTPLLPGLELDTARLWA